jgi:hypothetical protein
MTDTQRIGFRRSFRAVLICFLWTIAIWLVLFAEALGRKLGIGAGSASLLKFSVPVLAGLIAYQLVMVPWLDGDRASPRARFFWMILAPCTLAALVLWIAR